MKKLFLFISITVCLFYSCRPARNIQTAIAKTDSVAIAETIPNDKASKDSLLFIRDTYSKIMSNRVAYSTFSAKIDLDYEDGEGKKYNVNAHVRMQRDSVIWISVTAILGIEGLRINITRDSVRLLDKQNKIYTGRSISFLQELTGLPLELSTLQDLLVGNPVFLDSSIHAYTKTESSISLNSAGDLFKNLFTISEKDYSTQSSKLDDLDLQRNRTCYLTYSEYKNKKGINFSEKRAIQVSEKKKRYFKLEFKQYEFNEKLSFPFTIPKNYEHN